MEHRSNKIRIIILLIAIAVIAAAVGIVTFSNSSAQRVRKQLDLGQKYLSELDYEHAVAAFKEALAIDPNNKDVIEGIAKTYSDWSSSLVADKDFNSAVEKLDEARSLLPYNEELIDREVDVYLAWINSFENAEDYSSAHDIAAEGFEKLGDERLKSKLDELNAKIDEFESKEAPIKAKCTLIYYNDMAMAIAEEHIYEYNMLWDLFGVRFSEPIAFTDMNDGSTVMLTEANLNQDKFTALLGGVVDGQMIINDEYFDKELELFFYPYTYVPDWFTYTEDGLGFMGYDDDGKPRYTVLPLGCYYVSIATESEDIFNGISKQDSNGAENKAEEKNVDTSELATFMDKGEQNILKAFPDAKKQGENGDVWYMIEGETVDYAIAGPFFYFDGDGNVNQVGYSGTKYKILGIYNGMSVQDAIAVLESDGWVVESTSFTHGTGTCNVTLVKGDLEYFIDTDQYDAPMGFEISDLTGNVARMYLERN